MKAKKLVGTFEIGIMTMKPSRIEKFHHTTMKHGHSPCPDSTYIPSSAEAVLVLVSCSAFINYLHAKMVK